MQQGIVIKSTGSWYQVKLQTEKVISCRIKGKFRLKGLSLTNPVAVGDEVMVELENNEEVGTIKKILPRKNYVIRQSPRKKHSLHLLASNVDQAVLFNTISNPNIKQGFIDRFLLMVEPYNIPTLIIFNKADIYNDQDMAVFEYLKDIYKAIGYKVFLISALERLGLEDLKEALKDKISLISGQSGVGKSTLINALDSELELKTQELSDYSGKGQHTTTFAEMFDLSFGGAIIDTPGLKMLSFNNLDKKEVSHNFREFFEYSKDCKFADCMHRAEPKCAVKAAIETGEISELRYANYITIIEEIEGQNYWEKHDM